MVRSRRAASSLLGVCSVIGVLLVLCGVGRCTRFSEEPAPAMPAEFPVPLPSPGPRGVVHNDYRCTASSTQLSDGYIVQFEPRADPRLVHHMLLFGCKYEPPQGSWDCKSTSFLCGRADNPQIVFAWALNASGLHLPEGVGYRVGPTTGINYLVVQIHYGHIEDVPDPSAISQETLHIHTTQKRQPFVAGIFLMGSGGKVQAGANEASVYSACEFEGPQTIHPFAFRTHAHTKGKQIVGYVVRNNHWEMIGTRSPQDPQAFYPVGKEVSVEPKDWLAVRCVFNTEHVHHSVHMGPDSEDEMCNFYIMYYKSNDGMGLTSRSCWAPPPAGLHYPRLPPLPHIDAHEREEESESPHSHSGMEGHGVSHNVPTAVPLPPPREISMTTTASPTLIPTASTAPAVGTLVQAEDWALNGYPIPAKTLGQIVAVAVDIAGDVHILHRGPVVWNALSFKPNHVYAQQDKGPIKVPTLLKFSSTTGKPDIAWGASIFYMPHGLTIDHKGSFWVTDVAMHQVFKFTDFGDSEPSLVLGEAFKPGSAYNRFCQPTSVAVETSGNFYVADGYCNHRIMKYNQQGELAEVWEATVGGIHLFVPHKVILNAANDILYVADRENHRVVTYATSEGGHGSVFAQEVLLGGAPYAITFGNSSSDWPMYGVLGGISEDKLMGFTLDANGRKIGTWGPSEGFLKPHDVTMDTVHKAVYVTEIGPNRIWKFVPFPSTPKELGEDLEKVLRVPSNSTSTPHPTVSSTGPTSVATPTTTDSTVEEGSGNATDQNVSNDAESSKKPMAGVNVGVVIAVVAVLVLVVLVIVGVLKEHRLIRFKSWRLLRAGERDMTVGVKPSGTTTRRTEEKQKKKRMTPQKKLQSLLGPSQLGFSRLKTYDSNSEDEEFPVFNRV